MSPLPNVSQAYKLFSQEERHKEISALSTHLSHSDTVALAAQQPRSDAFQNRGYRSQGYGRGTSVDFAAQGVNSISGSGYNTALPSSNSRGFQQNRGGRYKRPSNTTYFCSHCQKPGHTYARCFRIHGFPPGFTGFKDKKVAAASHSTHSSDCVQPAADSFQLTMPQSAHQNSVSSSDIGPPSTVSIEQYNYLVELLNKQSSSASANSAVVTFLVLRQVSIAFSLARIHLGFLIVVPLITFALTWLCLPHLHLFLLVILLLPYLMVLVFRFNIKAQLLCLVVCVFMMCYLFLSFISILFLFTNYVWICIVPFLLLTMHVFFRSSQ